MDPVSNRPLDVLASIGVVPVATFEHADTAVSATAALEAGGLPCVEITLRTSAGLDAIAAVRAAHPGVIVGAGTVLDEPSARRAVDAGAAFVVSPGFDDGVVAWCIANGVAVLPGVATPTEMMWALAAGLTTVKFFPARATGGVEALAAVHPVFPDLRFVPTGGIRPDDLPAYLGLGTVAAVGGSWMIEPGLVADGDWAEIESRSADAVRRVLEIRGTTT